MRWDMKHCLDGAGCSRAGSREGLVCSVNNQGRAEHHHEFWALVAGEELEWRDCDDTDTLDTLPNKVKIAGSEWSQGAIGLFEDMVGTVNRCQVRLSSIQGSRHPSPVHVRSLQGGQRPLPAL